MNWFRQIPLVVGAATVSVLVVSAPSLADESLAFNTDLTLSRLEQQIWAQEERLAEQERNLAEQTRLLREQQEAIERQKREFEALRAGTYAQKNGQLIPAVSRVILPNGSPAMAYPRTQAQAEPPSTPPQQAPAAEKPARPEVPALAERGGVLTPGGFLTVEPSIQYSHSSINRFIFQGIEIFDVILIGQIDASDADRDTVQVAGTVRYGVTDRLELEAKVPFVYRNDRVTNLIVSGTDPDRSVTATTDGTGLGDIEIAAHYQLNSGLEDWPIFVGNLRVKSDSGNGPFDVDRDQDGIATELATGSGFWSIEPSVTVLYPSDPAVLWGNIGYLWNIERDVDTTIGASLIGDVDPGDAIRGGFGIGLSLNERLSLSLGYSHDFILKTTTEINGSDVDSERLQVGSFLFGLFYRVTDSSAVNLNVKVGVTEDSPDVQVNLRIPFTLELF